MYSTVFWTDDPCTEATLHAAIENVVEDRQPEPEMIEGVTKIGNYTIMMIQIFELEAGEGQSKAPYLWVSANTFEELHDLLFLAITLLGSCATLLELIEQSAIALSS